MSRQRAGAADDVAAARETDSASAVADGQLGSPQAKSTPDATDDGARGADADGADRPGPTRSGPDADGAAEEAIVSTDRWDWLTGAALALLGIGVLAEVSGLVLLAALLLALAGYAALTEPPSIALSLDRSVDETSPSPGDTVRVTVTVRNETDHYLPSLRLVDHVPDGVSVTGGTARQATALRPGGTTTLSYEIRARRGTLVFDGLTAVSADPAGASERRRRVAGRTELTCEPELPVEAPRFPLRATTTRHTGRFPADEGGPGVEFFATRQYRPGDPLSRVDWRRLARTGELSTVEYRVERSVRVVLAVDARPVAYRAPTGADRTAVERSVAAAQQAYVGLTAEDHRVGITALSAADCWLAPGNGAGHRARARHLFATSPALDGTTPAGECSLYSTLRRLRSRLPTDAQVVVLSPLLDDHLVDVLTRLDAGGHPVTVFSPDPAGDGAAGERVAGVERSLRVARLRRRGVPVFDWGHSERYERALSRPGGRRA